jgi:hypothetical protein
MPALRGQGLVLVAALAGAAVVGGVGCGANDIPINPTYSREIKPLMEAHCIRCHGAGGTLNLDPDSAKVNSVQAPTSGDFTALADDAAGKHGLIWYTVAPGSALWTAFFPQMPPAPAPGLTDREYQILTTWIASPMP